VQDGHVDLVNRLLACMEVGGEIIFVTTFRRLKLQESRLRRARVREITRQTVPEDFRNKKVHRAWSIVHTAS
jgi:23S rRNA G2069 N7-methylase RlmK/C1962 C5-methylase RlmI